MRTRPTASLQENTTLQVLRDLANRARALHAQAEDYTRQIEEMVCSLAPSLLEEPGVGPICAGRLLAFNPARFTSEAAFAHANGTAPQPASSGKPSATDPAAEETAKSTQRSTRSPYHAPSTTPKAAPTCTAESTKEKTKREAMRSLKRYLSRHLYNQLTKTPLTT
jgi:transposase